jgi:hypothetical protein
MRNIRQRLERLERAYLNFPRISESQLPPSPLDQIGSLVIKQLSDEDLELLIKVANKSHAGVSRELLQSESEALDRWGAAVDREAWRMGFRSFADAFRRAGKIRRGPSPGAC